MKRFLIITLFFLCSFILQSQEIFFVTATNGLVVRVQPNTNANRIGKLPFGSLVELIKNTNIKLQITDSGETINGEWIKIKFNNFPFIVSEINEFKMQEEGYIFNGFIEKLQKATIETVQIDSLKFYSLYQKPIAYKAIKIELKEEVEKLLLSNVKWKDIKNLGRVIDEINLQNGQVLHINQESNDYNFHAYYPIEDVILFEGGHNIDISISLKTGETLETTGNPEYIVESPNKKIRLNGWFDGQECSSYFFQEKIGESYKYLAVFDRDVCNFTKFYWLNNQDFIYTFIDYLSNESEKETYVIGRIKHI